MISMSGSGTMATRWAPHAGHFSADAVSPDCLSLIARPMLQIAPTRVESPRAWVDVQARYSSAGAWMRSSRGFPQPGTPQKTVRV